MTKEDDPQECVQTLRSVNRSLPPSSIPPPSPDDIFHVDTIVDPNTQKRVVLWDDILQVFEDAVQAQHNLEPRRIAAIPNTVLDVIVADPSADMEAVSPANGPKETASVPRLREEIGDRTTLVMPTQETTSNSAIRRNPIHGLENTAMDNYSISTIQPLHHRLEDHKQ
ncbi:hypothetical protein BGZ90_007652 [Linnemannia elongata]|nr:hypothetical protein BGZ90_007652 [Linnemannia elongata]